MNSYPTQVTEVSGGGEAPAGWVRVAMPHLGAEAESEWTPWPSLMVGNGFGLWLPPRVGVRCRVGFDDDDEQQEQPVIMKIYSDAEFVAAGEDLQEARLKLAADMPFEIMVGSTRLRVQSGQVHVNGDAFRLARADRVEQRLNNLEAWAATHTHPVSVGVLTGFASPSTPAPSTTTPNQTASDVARCGS
jgi:hypothetical protein